MERKDIVQIFIEVDDLVAYGMGGKRKEVNF